MKISLSNINQVIVVFFDDSQNDNPVVHVALLFGNFVEGIEYIFVPILFATGISGPIIHQRIGRFPAIEWLQILQKPALIP